MRRATRATRTFPSLFLAIGVAGLSVGCAPEAPAPAGDGPFTDEDRAAVQAQWDAVAEADAAADWETAATLITDDFMHLDPRVGGPVDGKAAWRDWVQGMDFTPGEITYTVEDLSGSGDLAYVVWTMSGSWTEGDESVNTTGKGITVFARQDDGSWLIVRNAWNADPEEG